MHLLLLIISIVPPHRQWRLSRLIEKELTVPLMTGDNPSAATATIPWEPLHWLITTFSLDECRVFTPLWLLANGKYLSYLPRSTWLKVIRLLSYSHYTFLSHIQFLITWTNLQNHSTACSKQTFIHSRRSRPSLSDAITTSMQTLPWRRTRYCTLIQTLKFINRRQGLFRMDYTCEDIITELPTYCSEQ